MVAHASRHFHFHPYLPHHLWGVLLFPKEMGKSHLEASFTLRCFQRLSRPYIATQRCSWRNNWYTSGICPSRSSRTQGQVLSNFLRPRRMGTELVSRRFWTQLAYRFNGRTAQPLGTDYSPRMRWATDIEVPNLPVDVDSWGDKPVIPRVAFIRWAMALPYGTTGSLSPTFRPCSTCLCLAVKLACAFTLCAWFPTILTGEPLGASVTF